MWSWASSGSHSRAFGVLKQLYTAMQDRVWQFLLKWNIRLPCDPAVPLVGICPGEKKVYFLQRCVHKCSNVCSNVCSNFVPNSPKLETPQMVTHSSWDKQIEVHPLSRAQQ